MRRIALVAGLCALARPAPAVTQLSASADAGASVVRYDGFLASAAGSVSPALRFDSRSVSVTARSAYLRFESGNTSLDGQVAAVWLAPLDPGRRWRAEIAVGGGASKYADIARFWHGVADARLHRLDRNMGAWVGVSGGRASFGRSPRPVAVAAAGLWTVRSSFTLLASLDRSFVGDTAYSDLRASARARRGSFSVDGSVGARFWSRGGGRGVYGEGSATLQLGRAVALVLSGGRYPTDAIRGSIAGRYATLALRVGNRWGGRAARPVSARPLGAGSGADRPNVPGHPSIERVIVDGEAVRLIVVAPEAARVEIAGTLTDWRPVSLTRSATAGRWELVLSPPPRGLHRLNVRVNGGAWLAPGGINRVTDDYDAEVGVLVIP